MARGFSKVIIMGNVVRDPETRSTSTGNSITSFSVAVNRSYRG
ncbi:single-stranded DNA-binding protein, partial [Candidatus Saccharibacteria bacterium]|nr:single-stranded DNA-binding protein [Candidatus Saccharibacteria bacterium]